MAENLTEFGAALNSAIEARDNDITRFVWKGKDGKEVRLVDMSPAELQKVYDHATDMLYNTNKYLPGRYVVKNNIKVLIAECNAELLLRYILHECHIDILRTNIQIIEFIRTHKATDGLTDNDSVTSIFTGLPSEFETVTLGELISACLDKLGVINRKMISDKFILSQGIWLTEDEKDNLTEKDESGKTRNWLDVMKERLFLNNITLRVDPKGFSYSEFRSLIHIESLTKISRLPSSTLRLLRDKVLVLLDADTDYHINKWLTIQSNIEKVACAGKMLLNKKVYSC